MPVFVALRDECALFWRIIPLPTLAYNWGSPQIADRFFGNP